MTDVTCAIIRDEDAKVLVVQRGKESDHPFKWEFPGGKTLQGESHEDCIIREIREELALDIVICSLLEPVEYDYGFKQIRLIPFVCSTLSKEPVLSEHIAYRWVEVDKLMGVNLQEADVIVAEKYLRYIKLQHVKKLGASG
ncbi:MAG: (deoxy)nucleoside triphosphate pyrophosphohydrolase [Bacteroidales bacterium]